jgi:hypothetical protein
MVVSVGPNNYQTDTTGSVRLANDTTLPAAVQADSPEFLLRETVVRTGDDHVLSLWPRRSPTGLTEDLTRQLVYTDAAGGATGAMPLHRLNPGTVSIVPSRELLDDADAMVAHRNAAAALTSATHGLVQFQVEASPSSSVVVQTGIDPSDPNMGGHAALTYRYTSGGQITDARTVFLSMDVARMTAVVMHELGHSFGLEHSSDARDLMYPMVSAGKQLSSRETLAIDLMLKRRLGNRFPDDDREGPAAQGRTVEIVACR